MASNDKIGNDLVSDLRARRSDGTDPIPLGEFQHLSQLINPGKQQTKPCPGPATRSTSQEYKPNWPHLKTIALTACDLFPLPSFDLDMSRLQVGSILITATHAALRMPRL
jgi:hypothetical protein